MIGVLSLVEQGKGAVSMVLVGVVVDAWRLGVSVPG
jgi:hypothetical protein